MSRRLEHQSDTIARLQSELTESDELRGENQSLQDRVTDLTARLKQLSAELDDSLDANAKAQDRIRDVENELHQHTVKIRQLRRQRGSIADIADDSSDQQGRRAA